MNNKNPLSIITDKLLNRTRSFSEEVTSLRFNEPIKMVYNPLDYAWEGQKMYLKKYAYSHKKIIFLGMNPGPWGMVQTGVPFGEISAVKSWMNIEADIQKPNIEHPKRKVEGFNCQKSEVSGRRLWGYFGAKFNNADAFFKDHFVANYCPLVFMEESGKNFTPDKLPNNEKERLFNLCDKYLADCVEILKPEWLIGIGRFAEKCAQRALKEKKIRIGHILHPSPASPAANRGWAEAAERQLSDLGLQ